MFCTYLTVYSGNKLPPFYIGSSSVERIENGYNGSVMSLEYKTLWESEQIENPHLFKTKIISLHKTREAAYLMEQKIHEIYDVVSSSLYINKATAVGSGKFGNGFKGKHHTEEHKKYMSEKLTGRDTYWLKGKIRPDHSEKMMGENNPMFGMKGSKHPSFGKKREDRFCCLGCKKESINSNIRHHIKCFNTSSN